MVGGTVGQQRAALQCAGSGLERNRIGTAGQIELCEFNRTARAERKRLGYRAIAGGAQALRFHTQPITYGVSPGFIYNDVDGLCGLAALGVLGGNGDTAENSQIVETALRFHDRAFT